MRPRWIAIAKAEYRIRTCRIRPIRPYFPVLAIVLLGVFVVWVAPAIVGAFVDEVVAFLLSNLALAAIQLSLLVLFFFLVLMPFTVSVREMRTAQLDTLLSAPLKTGDILLGEFVGTMPLNGIAVAAFAGVFLALFDPLGLDLAQKAVLVVSLVLLLLTALWIGAVLGAIARARLSRYARGKDLGNAVGILTVIPVVGLMYALMEGSILQGLAAWQSGAGGIVLNVFPSSWVAATFLDFAAHPGDLAAVGGGTLLRVGGLVAFCAASLWIGAVVANRTYDLELTTLGPARAKPEGVFYRSARRLAGGRSFGTLVAGTLKEYARRADNLSWTIYGVSIVLMMAMLLIKPEDPLDLLFISVFIVPLLITTTSADAVLRGKEMLFVYRKAPGGVKRYARALLVKTWLVTIPVVVIIVSLSTLVAPRATPLAWLINVTFAVLLAVASSAFVLGLYFAMPASSDDPKAKNVTLAAVLTFSIMVPMMLMIGLFVVMNSPFTGLVAVIPAMGILGPSVLAFGTRNLATME